MEAPQISVIITTYNVERYIVRTIASALSQEGVSLELVVVDDRSRDETWNVVTALAQQDARIRPVQMEVNGGPGAARNRAIKEARGAWVAVLDGDDVYLPGRLARMLALAEKTQADIVVDNQQLQPEEGSPPTSMFNEQALRAVPLLTAKHFVESNSSFHAGHDYGYFKPLIRTEFLRQKNIHYPEEIRIGEDYGFMLELLASGAVCAVSAEMGYGYTVRAGSISHRLKETDIAAMMTQDARIFARYVMGPDVQRYQVLRTRRLNEMLYYTRMLNAAKAKDVKAFVAATLACPAALRYWRAPIQIRLKRLIKG